MSRARASTAVVESAEFLLERATLARSPRVRAKYAKRGLGECAEPDATTRLMLLRQLYLSHLEARRFESAKAVAEQMVELEVMPDVARQDAARACLGFGNRQEAIQHLRLASRVCPPARRAFHLWTLGSVYYLGEQYPEAIGALSRAVRWGTTDKPLYMGQLALARSAAGETIPNLRALRERLADAPCGQGYGQFVLGELAFREGDYPEARRYLSTFVKRVTNGRVALAVALSAEVAVARRLLSRLRGRIPKMER